MYFSCSKVEILAYSVHSKFLSPIVLDFSCHFLSISLFVISLTPHTPRSITYLELTCPWSLAVLETISISPAAGINEDIMSTEKCGFQKVRDRAFSVRVIYLRIYMCYMDAF